MSKFSFRICCFAQLLALLSITSTGYCLNDCSNPYIVAIPADLPRYSGVLTTCGASTGPWITDCLPAGYENSLYAIHRLDVTTRTRVRIVLNTSIPTPHPAFTVLTACDGTAQCVANAYSMENYWVSTDVTLEVGTYYVKVCNWQMPTCLGAYGLDIIQIPFDPGEICGQAIELGSLPANVSGNTCSYVNDYDYDCPNNSSSPDVVYRYTAPGYQEVTFDLCGSDYDTKLMIYAGDCEYGSLWMCDDDGGAGVCPDPTRSFLQCFPLEEGVTYYIVVDGSNNQCGNYNLVVTPCVAEGDLCDNAWVIDALPYVAEGSTCGMSDDYDFPCPNASASPDMVMLYSPTTDVDATLDFCASDYDVKIWVMEDCAGGAIMCADDTPGICGGNPLAPFVTCMSFIGGHNYYIVVDGSNDECGNWSLAMTECLHGELFENPIVLSAQLPQTVTGNTCAYQHNYDWACPDAGDSPDVVYRYTPDRDIMMNIDLCESAYDAKVAVWGGLEGQLISCSEYGNGWCADDSRPYLSCVPMTSGLNYFIVIDGSMSFLCGDYTMTLRECYPERLCASCEPVNAALGEIPMERCAGSVAGTCEWNGKWIASFVGHAGWSYIFDACDWPNCGGSANFDVDMVILGESCEVLAYVDGEGDCDWRPNDWNWNCPADGNYFILISPYEAIAGGELTCSGSVENSFNLVYYRDGSGETCETAKTIAALPYSDTGMSCDYANNYEEECWQYTELGGRDFVYRYDCLADELVTFNLCGTQFQSKLYIYADDCTGDPVACNAAGEQCAEWYNSFLSCVPLLGGHTYYIVVDAINEWECGNYTFEANACEMLPGDLIETAFEVTSLPYSDENNTSGFFNQYTEECGGFSVAKDVVYKFTPQSNMSVEVDLCNSCFDNRLYIYENTRDNMLACDDGGCWPSARAYLAGVDLYAGNTYYFVVDGDYSARGQYQIDILERVLGQCCRTDGNCSDYVTSRQCAYHLGRGYWFEGTDCSTPCPILPPPPPGAIQVAQAPVVNGCGYGIHMAVNCSGEIFYNNTCSEILYSMDKDGNYLDEVVVTRNGNSIWFGTGCWDTDRDMLWCHNDSDVGLIDPVTGEFMFRFNTLGIVFEWMAFDQTDHTLWFAVWSCSEIMHFDTSGNYLGSILAKDAMGNLDVVMKGIAAANDGSLCISHNDARVTRIDKTTGVFIETLMLQQDSGGAAVAFDAHSFPGQTVLWWKFGASASAYAMPSGQWQCECLPADSLTVRRNGNSMELNFSAPEPGVYNIYRSPVYSEYPTNYVLIESMNLTAGHHVWTDPDAIDAYGLYVVERGCE